MSEEGNLKRLTQVQLDTHLAAVADGTIANIHAKYRALQAKEESDISIIGFGWPIMIGNEFIVFNECLYFKLEVFAYPDEFSDEYIKAHFYNKDPNGDQWNEVIYDMFKKMLFEGCMARIGIRSLLKAGGTLG